MTVSYASAPALPPGTPAHTRWGWINAYGVVAIAVLSIVQLWAMSDVMLKYFREMAFLIATARTAPGGYPSSIATGMFAEMMPMTIAFTLIGLVSWALFALCVVAAYRDHRDLGRLGYPRRFHWAWSFFGLFTPFGLLVYPIGRAVVVHRQSGAGWAPMWLAIAATTVGLLVTLGGAVWLFFSMFDAIASMRAMVA
ncbi:hypothetical protein ACIPY5_04510 [Microbacterium sp. NPDC089698]|uniref:hypothetical protein n=1 Tax=Microbacterium sp. NPDC089698 TaxID=3364200 RepID=UPI0038066BD1